MLTSHWPASEEGSMALTLIATYPTFLSPSKLYDSLLIPSFPTPTMYIPSQWRCYFLIGFYTRGLVPPIDFYFMGMCML